MGILYYSLEGVVSLSDRSPSVNCHGLQRMAVRSGDGRGRHLFYKLCLPLSASKLPSWFCFVSIKWANIKTHSHRIVGRFERINMKAF